MKEKSRTVSRGVTFRRFSRGSYAAFASLHREVRIGVLAIGMLSSVNLPKVEAAQPTTTATTADSTAIAADEDLSEVTVSGTMSPLSQLQSARIVGVITRQQIESSAVQTVNDLLKLAVGVDVRQRGGFGIQTDISIDGGTFDQITLLLNGVNISSPHTGHLAADFPVSLSDIQRIEILEGAASRVYGASAFGGAINIVTKHDSHPLTSLDAGAHGGSYATFGGDARLALNRVLGGGLFSTSLSATYQRSDGATVNSDFQRGNAYFNTRYDADDFGLHLQAGYSQKAYGANTFYSAAYPNQYERNRRFIFSLGAETKGRIRLRPEVYWNRLVDNFELIRGTTTGENFHRTDVHGARVTADIAWIAGRTAVGAEVREEGIYSTSLGLPIQGKLLHKVAGEDELYYKNHDNRTNLSFNVEHSVVLPHFTASIGVLANKNSRFDDRLRFYPGIDLAYTPSSHWRLFASYNKGFRLPTFTDLYYKSPTHQGNQGMRAEESHSFQLGTKANYQFGRVFTNYTLKGFYHRGTNMIDWVMYTADDVFHSANFDLDNLGVQVEATASYKRVLLNLAYSYIHQRRHDDINIFKSNYAMEYLRHKFVATLHHPIVSHLSASWTFRWQNRMGSYILYEDAKSTGQLVPYDPYATLDLKLRWTAKHYELWAEATNITNHRYYDLGNIPQPGIIVLAGARVKF
ncbi:MAG: TonB-dependent receptor [Bacteroidaceae bacterium]|nr:TonB-dependent receptor [Bacteroidaceae bacterium]